MLKRALLTAAALGGLAVGSTAHAADLPSRVEAPPAPAPAPVVPVFTWTGFYIGANAGYGWKTNDKDEVYVPGTGYVAESGRSKGGFVGGGQVGYNYQFGQFVAGVEADIQYADLKAKNGSVYYDPTTGTYAAAGNHGIDWFGTARGRLGFALDRALIYGTGGFAYGGGGNGNGTYVDGVYYKNNDDVRTGWTLGGGVEYAFTDNITARVEGLYVNLGHDKDGIDTVAYEGRNKDLEFGVVRAGLNFKFNNF